VKHRKPIPSDWFDHRRLILVIDGGIRSFHSLHLIERLSEDFSPELQLWLTEEAATYLPKTLLQHFTPEVRIWSDGTTFGDRFTGDCLISLHFPSDRPNTTDSTAKFFPRFEGPVLRVLDGYPPENDYPETMEYTENWDPVIERLAQLCSNDRSWAGRCVLITAGPTEEPVDPVRMITNRSSGKMGFALARQARLRGAKVILVSGPVELESSPGVHRIDVTTAEEMLAAATEHYPKTDAVFAAAAVEDLKPVQISAEKIKKRDRISIECEQVPDILATLAGEKTGQYLVGFSVETENIIENSAEKLRRKDLDLIVVNNPGEPGAGFRHDTNKASLITRDGTVTELELMSKDALAGKLLEFCGKEMSRDGR